jgi:hypothetical protein
MKEVSAHIPQIAWHQACQRVSLACSPLNFQPKYGHGSAIVALRILNDKARVGLNKFFRWE